MKHLRKFNTAADRTAFMQNTPIPVYPYVHYVADTKTAIFSDAEVDLPMYLECINTLTFKFSNNFEYSFDGVTWEPATSSTSVSSTKPGQRIYVRATGLTATSSNGIGKFSISSGNCAVGGNIMSMLYGAEYRGQTEITQTYAFYKLFNQATRIKSARNLALPATILTDYCYACLFYGCTGLVDAPALPATVLTPYCYYYAFYGCSALVNAPVISAKELAKYCFAYTFAACTALVDAPALSATKLAEYCYYSTFYGCSNLINAPALPATELAKFCYYSTFHNCTSLVNAQALPAKVLMPGCYYSMYRGCKALVNAPLIAATTLADVILVSSSNYGCCAYMFCECTSLAKGPTLLAETLTDFCYYNMFNGCSKLSYIKAMYTTTASSSTGTWVSGVASEGVFVKNSAASWENQFGTSNIPTGWTVELADA